VLLRKLEWSVILILWTTKFLFKMKEKECFKCGQVLPLTHFYKHKQMADGYLNKCKECNKKDSRDMDERKIEDPKWKLKERIRSRKKMRKYREEGKEKPVSKESKAITNKRYMEKYPEKYAAHIASQRMVPEPCEVCGSTKNIEGHHEDYSKPKDITWLCKKHHDERHVKIREEELLR